MFKDRFFSKQDDFGDIYGTLNANIKDLALIIAQKLVYKEFKGLIWDYLYFEDESGNMRTIDCCIDQLTPLMKDLKEFTDKPLFSLLMSTLLQVFSDVYVDYLAVYLSNVANRSFQRPTRMITKDVGVFIDYFS
jgi:hypothetical protein